MSPSYIQFSSTPEVRHVLKQALQFLNELASIPSTPAIVCPSTSKFPESDKTATKPKPPETDAHASPFDKSSTARESNQDDDPTLQLLMLQRDALSSFANSKDGDPVPYRLIRAACCVLKRKGLRKRDQTRGPFLHIVLKGSSLQLPTPPARQKVSLGHLRPCAAAQEALCSQAAEILRLKSPSSRR